MSLKSCPFCGTRKHNMRIIKRIVHIECSNCGAMGPAGSSLLEAEKSWNNSKENANYSYKKQKDMPKTAFSTKLSVGMYVLYDKNHFPNRIFQIRRIIPYHQDYDFVETQPYYYDPEFQVIGEQKPMLTFIVKRGSTVLVDITFSQNGG